jgi:hypothetical protein
MTPQRPHQLRLAYLIDQPLTESKLDPARVDLGKHANLLRALYSRLVEFDLDGSLRPSLASSFEVNDREVTFNIPQTIKTFSGKQITAKDAAYSLIRLLVLKSNRHSSLSTFICGKELSSVTDHCEGIQFSENKLTIILKDAKFAKFILPILASTDFSIIPYDSIDWKNKELSIIEYKNTSGVYYVESDFDKTTGSASLRKNLTHPSAKPEIADTVTLVSTTNENALEKFERNEIDAIPTIFQFTKKIIDRAIAEQGFIHETLPIKIWFLNNLHNGNTEFTKEEILYISSLIKIHTPLDELSYKCEKSNFLFPPSSEGNLLDADVDRIGKMWSKVKTVPISKKFKLWVPSAKVETFKRALTSYSFIEVYSDNALPLLKPLNQQPHGMIVAMDSTFFEDLSMLNYNFSIGTFGFSKDKADEWIKQYINIEEKSERISKLRTLHLSLLIDLKIVPLGLSPYFAIAKPGWKIDFSKYYAGSPQWRIKKN